MEDRCKHDCRWWKNYLVKKGFKLKVLFVVYDNESYISYFPLGIGYLSSVLRKKDYEVTIYNQDVYHYPEEHLVEYLKNNHFDVIGIGVIAGYYQYRKLLKLSQAINSVENRPFFIIGGHGPSPEPEFFLKKTQADAVLIGEGEIILLNLFDALNSKKSLSTVKSIAYWDGDKVVVNEREDPVKDVDSIPMPAWDLFPMEYYTLMRAPLVKPMQRTFQVLTGRGCPYSCNFCYRLEPGYRLRSPEAVIEELNILKKDYNVTFFDFVDDLFMFGQERIIDFCEKIMNSKLGIHFICEGRLNFATPEVLDIMKRAGCLFINYGIESLDEATLKVMNKKLTVEQIIKGIENTISLGIHPGLNIIFGNIGENKKSLQKGVDFLLKYNTHAQFRTIRPVTPYPGSPLYYYAIEKGLLEGPEDFYEKKHLNSDLIAVNFTELSDEEFYRLLFEANKILIEDYFEKQKQNYSDIMKKLYFEKNISFRGFRQT